LHEGLLAQR